MLRIKRLRLRIFHPPKLWLSLAALMLTVGISMGEIQATLDATPVQVASKMSRNLEVSSFNYFTSAKQGVMRPNYRVSFLGVNEKNPLFKEESQKSGQKRVCFWQDSSTEEPLYQAEVTEVKMPEKIASGESFRVEVYVKNTGNRIWYSQDSGCEGKTIVHMGTEKSRDRASVFYQSGEETGWVGDNRVEMIQDAVPPQQTATFVFSSLAPQSTSIYREYFGLVAEHVTWFEGFDFSLDIRVGEVTENDEYKLKFISETLDTASLTGAAHIEVSLAQQTMWLKFGDKVVYTLPISSGARQTPTPTGNYTILNQQELRIGGKAPHYRMPKWQGFTRMGHGLHALPYLATDGGVFWSEAFSHIGIPVSHGCIRMLPDDAAKVYEFGQIGMALNIHR